MASRSISIPIRFLHLLQDNFKGRQALNYDEVMQKQRQLIYSMRDELLDGGRIGKERLLQIAENNIQTFVGGFSGKQPVSRQAVSRYLLDNISYQMDDISDSILQGKESVTQYLRKQVEAALQEQESRIGGEETVIGSCQSHHQIACQEILVKDDLFNKIYPF